MVPGVHFPICDWPGPRLEKEKSSMGKRQCIAGSGGDSSGGRKETAHSLVPYQSTITHRDGYRGTVVERNGVG